MKRLIAGNWKMNCAMDSAMALARDIVSGLQERPQLLENNQFIVCPPAVYLAPVQTELSAAVSLGAQDCSAQDNGAHTGDISVKMLKDLNCDYVILGHSERRTDYKETNDAVRLKAEKALSEGLIPIICVGETETQREKGQEQDVVRDQLKQSLPSKIERQNFVIAYEPVWAIGTGKTASVDDIKVMHDFIREELRALIQNADQIPLLYGGSVKPSNAKEIFAVDNVNGALIGGASLKADDFLGIAAA